MEFDHHTVVLLIRPADAPDLPNSELDRIQDAHLAYQAEQAAAGLLRAAGPVTGHPDEQMRGISVWSLPLDEVEARIAADPAVRAGRLRAEVMTWLVPAGQVVFSPVAPPRSMAEAEGSP